MDFPEKITIPSHTVTIRPRYSETDQGGVVHHSVFPVWFEVGRTELLRVNGISYSDLEKAGIFFVVSQLNIRYRRPVLYDQQLELTTVCSKVTAAKIEHCYELKYQGILLTQGSTVIAHLDRKGKVQRIPDFLYTE